MHFIIVGAGNVGRPLLNIASYSGNDVVVIERDETRANEIANNYDCLVLNADATRELTLEEAGADRADVLVTTTELDATNLFVSLLGNELGIPNIVSVLHRPEHRELFSKMGVNAVKSPHQLAADSLYRTARQPPIEDYMTVGGSAEVFTIDVADDAPIAGMTLQKARTNDVLPEDVLVVAIVPEDGDEPVIAGPMTRIDSGDNLTVYSGRGADSEVTDIFGLYETSR